MIARVKPTRKPALLLSSAREGNFILPRGRGDEESPKKGRKEGNIPGKTGGVSCSNGWREFYAGGQERRGGGNHEGKSLSSIHQKSTSHRRVSDRAISSEDGNRNSTMEERTKGE